MGEEIRPAGIDILGDIPWGTHFCQFYQTKEDLLDILVPYFKAGLENNEFCMWITAEPLKEQEAEEALRKALPDFDRYLQRGQMEILPHDEWYLKEGVFDLERVLNGWVDKLNKALAKGYDGLRLTGNTFWLEKKDWKSFAYYEAAVNNVIGNYRMIAICSYCLDKCDAAELIDVVINHQFSVIRREGEWKIIESGERKQAEEARKARKELEIHVKERTKQLQESEQRYRSIVETSNEGILIIDLNGVITFANQRMAELLGYAKEELLGRVAIDFVDADHKADVLRTRSDLLKGSRTQREFKFRRKDGSELWTSANSSPLLDNRGDHFANLTMYADITERKKAEADLAYLASFPGLNPMPVLELNMTGDVEYLNLSAKMFFPDLLVQGSQHPFLANWDILIDAVQNEKTHIHSRDVEVGSSWFEQTLCYLPSKQRVRLYSRDITKRKQAETELLLVNRELRAISECNQAMVRAIDEQTLLKDVCRIICDVAGYRMAWVGVAEHDDAKSIRPLAWGGAEDGYLANSVITWADTEHGSGPTGLAVRTGKTHFFQDFAAEPAATPWREAALARGYCSSIAIPLSDIAGNVFGVFSLYASQSNSFTPSEVELLEGLAGDLAFGISVLRDRMKRKQAEESLRETRDYLENLIDYANAPIIVWDPEFRITRFNHAFERLTGLKAEDVLGEKLDILFPHDRRDESMSHILRTAAGERWEVVEIPILRKDGEVRTVLWNSATLYDPDNKIAIATIAQGQDITERKQAEEALKLRTDEMTRSNAELEQFAYVASHDLQEPLRMVSSYVKLLAKRYKGKLDQDADEFIDYAHDGAMRMQRLINDLLAYSRVGTRGKKFEEVNLETVLAEALHNLKVVIKDSEAIITHDPLPSVYGDDGQLTQVFQNLIDNAIKFHGEELPKIHISAKVNRNECVFSVCDNGIGIAPEYYEKIFVLFQRLHTRKEYPGTGIGLSICKRIAERHGGRIWVESKPGAGSCFYFAISNSMPKE